MKVCTILVFCGVLLAAVISANSHPTGDVTTAKTTSVTSKDETSSDPVPPHVSPLLTSASSLSTTKTKSAGSLDSSESNSKESDERKSSTTAKSLFRRQADDQPDDGEEDDDDDSDGDDESDSGDTRSRRQLFGSQYEQKGSSLGQGEKFDNQKKDDQQSSEKIPPVHGAHVS